MEEHEIFSESEIDLNPGDQRVFRSRENYLETLNETEFIRRFRMSKRTFILLLNEIKPVIARSTLR